MYRYIDERDVSDQRGYESNVHRRNQLEKQNPKETAYYQSESKMVWLDIEYIQGIEEMNWREEILEKQKDIERLYFWSV